MSDGSLHLVAPEQIVDFVRDGRLNSTLLGIAQLAGVELTVQDTPASQPHTDPDLPAGAELPIEYSGQSTGSVFHSHAGQAQSVALAARTIASLMEHMVAREQAVADLAGEMLFSYEELNLLYTLLPKLATKSSEREIGTVLVAETARALNCRRVSLLVLDETHDHFHVLASCGLPEEVNDVIIPVGGSVARNALFEDDVFIVNNIAERPDLTKLSRGQYDSVSFAVVRMPLQAQGQAIGVLTVTDHVNESDFSAHDQKLLEGLSAMGASSLLNCRLHAEIDRQMLATIKALATAVDAKDHYTHDHSGRVSQLSVATAREMGITDPGLLRDIELTGLLHDIGKIGIPDAILSKRARLTAEEFDEVKAHAKIGARIIGHVHGLTRVAQAILHHHERYDGLGYPSALSADEIPQISRLIAVADVFDALTSDRPYRKAMTNEGAFKEIRRVRAIQFDPDIVDVFIRVADKTANLADKRPNTDPA